MKTDVADVPEEYHRALPELPPSPPQRNGDEFNQELIEKAEERNRRIQGE